MKRCFESLGFDMEEARVSVSVVLPEMLDLPATLSHCVRLRLLSAAVETLSLDSAFATGHVFRPHRFSAHAASGWGAYRLGS